MTGRRYRIAVIPGDGIGVETVAASRAVLDIVAESRGFTLDFTEYPWGCEYYERTGLMMDEDGLDELGVADSILLGAVGAPGVPDHVSLWGLLIPIRRHFDQYVSLRPSRSAAGATSPIDVLVVRENSEGEYSEIGGRIFAGTPEETVLQTAVFTRRGVERIARFAFDAARTRRGQVASATKSNGIIHSMPFWDEVVAQVAEDYPDVVLTRYHVDALAAMLVQHPERFDVILGSNLFGDILSDLTAALAGSIGIAPSGNINPTGRAPSMFEPVHGSAPDIVGQGIANPLGQISAAAMMLRQLGETTAADDVDAAVLHTMNGDIRTPDLGGSSLTTEVTAAVIARLTGS